MLPSPFRDALISSEAGYLLMMYSECLYWLTWPCQVYYKTDGALLPNYANVKTVFAVSIPPGFWGGFKMLLWPLPVSFTLIWIATIVLFLIICIVGKALEIPLLFVFVLEYVLLAIAFYCTLRAYSKMSEAGGMDVRDILKGDISLCGVASVGCLVSLALYWTGQIDLSRSFWVGAKA
jgi:hypothetical protein